MRISLAVLLVLFILSCKQEAFYQSELEINPESWNYDDSYDFPLSVSDTSNVYEMRLLVRHMEDYSYENLYLMVETFFPEQESRQERINIDLADKKGNWVGKCRSGECRVMVYMLESFRFPEIGDYVFTFNQHTRDKNLEGILSLELSIVEKNEDL